MDINFADQYLAELDRLSNEASFCREWKEKWRGLAIGAQGILKIFFPAGAKVLGYLIAIADKVCPSMK